MLPRGGKCHTEGKMNGVGMRHLPTLATLKQAVNQERRDRPQPRAPLRPRQCPVAPFTCATTPYLGPPGGRPLPFGQSPHGWGFAPLAPRVAGPPRPPKPIRLDWCRLARARRWATLVVVHGLNLAVPSLFFKEEQPPRPIDREAIDRAAPPARCGPFQVKKIVQMNNLRS